MEIDRRQRIAGLAYPFVKENSSVRVRSTSSSEFYKFLLLLSLKKSPLRKGKKYNEVDELFDKVVGEAVKNHFGNGTKILRFGWPPSEKRPHNFKKALDWLSGETGVRTGNNTGTPKNKDGGVDIVAWKPFLDNRTAFLIALVQCTVQLDWFPKAKDIHDMLWLARLDTARPAILSLAIPFIIETNYDKWDDLRRLVNLVFDRLRLSEYLATSDSSSFIKMLRWNRKELPKFVV